MRRVPLILALSLACGLSSIACKQGLGERCEQDSDCESGDCRGAGLTSAMGGICQDMQSAPDSGSPMTPRDAAIDLMSDATDATADATADVAVDATVDGTSGDDANAIDATDASDATD
jgi:hypothetical protein